MTEPLTDIWKEMLADEVVEGKREILQRFFKTGPGEYAEGDVFLGITNPSVRKVSKLVADAPAKAIEEMLCSGIHEYRLSALLVLVRQYHAARKKPEERRRIVEFYLSHTRHINNWDLVDLTAPKIIGEYVFETGKTEILSGLSRSTDLWEQRIAIVATYTLLCHGITKPTLEIATLYLNHNHDLIHKASGWMLREMGKRVDEKLLTDFLDLNTPVMPRTMLRYAIEKLSQTQRQYYLNLPRRR
ncbi:MAG: DNA alkylation repair protein [Staphylococcus sp.]|nr:DNA alkylation repair protein [Staphylococcus sp.]